MNTVSDQTLKLAYIALRVVTRASLDSLQPFVRQYHEAEGELVGVLGPDDVHIAELLVSHIAQEYASKVQSAKYAAVCP